MVILDDSIRNLFVFMPKFLCNDGIERALSLEHFLRDHWDSIIKWSTVRLEATVSFVARTEFLFVLRWSVDDMTAMLVTSSHSKKVIGNHL